MVTRQSATARFRKSAVVRLFPAVSSFFCCWKFEIERKLVTTNVLQKNWFPEMSFKFLNPWKCFVKRTCSLRWTELQIYSLHQLFCNRIFPAMSSNWVCQPLNIRDWKKTSIVSQNILVSPWWAVFGFRKSILSLVLNICANCKPEFCSLYWISKLTLLCFDNEC